MKYPKIFAFLLVFLFSSPLVFSQEPSPEKAKDIISKTSREVILAVKSNNFKKFSQFIHPSKGVRISLDAYVLLDQDLVFSSAQFAKLNLDKKKYMFGYADGSGDPIRLTLAQYFQKRLYAHDFSNAPQVGYNQTLGHGNSIDNAFKIYPKAILVEYYFPGLDPKADGMDWVSRRFIFEEYQGKWYLTAIIHDQWTT
ncbi:MAG: hypothetical protein HQM15_05435 [Deltaproteobacteria bacterium]|nr:hypothetical protein [Deltaproteobacteria bacterium]